jgi:hypothetical protein
MSPLRFRVPLRPTGMALLLLAIAASPADLLGARSAYADETGADKTGAQETSAESAAAKAPSHPSLRSEAFDLLPLDELEREAFNRAHGPLVYRAQAQEKKLRALNAKIAKTEAARAKAKDKKAHDAALRPMQKERRELRVQVAALFARLTDEVVAAGVAPWLIPVLNTAPQGPDRLERHSHRLVLLAPELRADQWDLCYGVLARMEGALDALRAQEERTTLAMKQAELTKEQAAGIKATFDQQRRLIDKRFWLLVDFVLDEDQRVALWQVLPQRMKHKSQAKEHLFLLQDLKPGQLARLQALTTELEQESAPDSAALKRLQNALRDKKLDAKTRKTLTNERGQAYARLSELRRFAATEIKKVLTKAQYREYLSIPPRLSVNDRRATNKLVLEGFKPSAKQQAAMKALAAEARAEKQQAAQALAALRRESQDYGPDSPQMMGMQMMMAGMQAAGSGQQRALMGRVFLEILSEEEVARWVLGHWGYKR